MKRFGKFIVIVVLLFVTSSCETRDIFVSYKVENEGHSVTHECFRWEKKLKKYIEKDFEANLQKIRECEKYQLLD